MKNKKIEWEDLSVAVNYTSFQPQNGVAEYHAIVEYTEKTHFADIQFKNIESAIKRLQRELSGSTLVLKRYFLSDAANQAKYLCEWQNNAATSIVQQAPLNGTKVASWLYFADNARLSETSLHEHVMERSSYKHLYHTQLHNPLKNEGAETDYIFSEYAGALAKHGCTLKDNCIRTWIYVQGVDVHYADMVKSRVAFFEEEGLTQDTHYIASTGIEGRYAHPQSLVLMDAYGIEGIKAEQVGYLQALTHLSPTYDYGVTFERGTSVDYGDRRHIFISGTASIDHKGEIMHPDDVMKQTERTFENIQALLSEADATMADVAKMIVYLRDTADYGNVSRYMQTHYANTPYVMVWAPVCRPGWLVEVECIALKEIENKQFDIF